MKASTILCSLAAGVAMANPIAQPSIPEGENVTLFCNDKSFGAYCAFIPSNNGECVALPGRHLGTTSSVLPISKGSLCYFFVNRKCDTSGGFFRAEYPGVADLSATPVNGPDGTTKDFDNKISSYRCSSN